MRVISNAEWLDFITNLSYIDPIDLIIASSKIPCPIQHKNIWCLESATFISWMKDYLPSDIEAEQALSKAQLEGLIGPEEHTTIENKQVSVYLYHRTAIDERIKELSSI